MGKLFEAQIQVVADDRATADDVQKQLESKLGSMKISEVFVREVNYMGDIDDLDEDDEDRIEEL